MKKNVSGALAGFIAAAVLAPSALAAPANVTVRVEGESQTLQPRTAVTTTTAPVLAEGANSCSGTSAGGALYDAVAGAVGGSWGAFGFQLKTVKGETQDSPPSSDPARYWSFWVNYRYQDQGLCATELQEGDDVLLFADCYSATAKCLAQIPLRISGVPATAAPGQAIGVKLEEFTTSFNGTTTDTTAEPAENATIVAGGQTATTGADGTARITLPRAGPVAIQASKPGRVRTAALTCVTTGSDGNCGSQLPPGAVLGTGHAGDKTAPIARLAGLRNGKVFKHGKGPRELKGSVTPDPSGLSAVRLSILRKAGRRCWTFDGSSERFARHRCGGWKYFKVGDRDAWSFLLPQRLGAGRYTIRVRATDKSGNHSESQVVIRVK